MEFHNLRIKDIHGVMVYEPNLKQWTTQNRINHIVGIQMSGSVLHNFENKQITLSEGCVFFFNQRESYTAEVSKIGKSFSVHFTTEEEIDTESFCMPISNMSNLLSVLEKIKSTYEIRNELMTLSLLYKFCGEMQRIRTKKYFPKEQRIFEFKRYLDSHYVDKNCLADAITASGISARRFGDLFKKCFDTTPQKYIILRRIDYAKELLMTGMFSISFVAEKSSFSDVYYFSRTFKKETGVSPSKYYHYI